MYGSKVRRTIMSVDSLWRAIIELFGNNLNIYNLNQDTPVSDQTIELSRGFASFFTADVFLQKIIAMIISPLFIILIIGIAGWIIYRLVRQYDRKMRAEVMQGQQLLLFKAKQLGLSNYQFKILKGIADFLHLEKPSFILDDPHLFERSIIRFMAFASRMGEKRDSIESICKDLIITYEKLYHHTDIRKPLAQLVDLETNTLIAFSVEGDKCCIGKIRGHKRDSFEVHVFSPNMIDFLRPGLDTKVLFWRAGDAEYEFNSVILSVMDKEVELQISHEFIRGTPVPHPLVDTLLPCTIYPSSIEGKGIASKPADADIFKINETEILIRCRSKMEHGLKHRIEFTINDFTIRTDVQIIRERYIPDHKIYYFNLKFIELSDAGKTVIGNYIIEHLFT
jgi:hypothetical protein